MKRTLSLLLVLVMVIAMIPNVFADTDKSDVEMDELTLGQEYNPQPAVVGETYKTAWNKHYYTITVAEAGDLQFTVENGTVAMQDADGNAITANEDGTYTVAAETAYIVVVTKTDTTAATTWIAENAACEHTYVKGVCSLCGEATLQLDEVTLAYAAQIEIRPKFYIPDEILNNDNLKLVITQQRAFNKPDQVSEYTMADIRAKKPESATGRYYFVHTFASGEMGKQMSIQLINTADNTVMTIRDYKTNTDKETITRTVAECGIEALQNPSTKDTLKDLIVAAIAYGGYAQVRFGVDADNPVYNLLTENGYALPDMSGLTADMLQNVSATSGADIGVSLYNETAVMDAAVAERVYFMLDDGRTVDEYTFKLTTIKANGTTVTTEVATTSHSSGAYYVVIPDIASAYIDYLYTVEVVDNTSGESFVVQTSVLSWVKNTIETSTNSKVVNLAKAMYYFNQAANVHFNR